MSLISREPNLRFEIHFHTRSLSLSLSLLIPQDHIIPVLTVVRLFYTVSINYTKSLTKANKKKRVSEWVSVWLSRFGLCMRSQREPITDTYTSSQRTPITERHYRTSRHLGETCRKKCKQVFKRSQQPVSHNLSLSPHTHTHTHRYRYRCCVYRQWLIHAFNKD